jgi:hypothetical protein
VCLDIHDHDIYPDDHARLLDHWEPGVTVWGLVRRVNCAGRVQPGRYRSLCAAAIPTDITVTPDHTGIIHGSVLSQTRAVDIESDVTKLLCVADWSWGLVPRGLCPHG